MSESVLQALFSPFEYKKLKLRNRIVMPPMTRNFSPGGLATDMMTDIETRAESAPTLKTIRAVAERLDRGEFDLVAVGRAMLADANWARKVKEGRFGELKGYSAEMMKTLI